MDISSNEFEFLANSVYPCYLSVTTSPKFLGMCSGPTADGLGNGGPSTDSADDLAFPNRMKIPGN